MSVVELTVNSPEEMRRLGSAFGRAAVAGDRFLLEGPFGAGKTTFVQGLAQGLDVTTPVSSPSFVIETQHRGRLRLYHIDLYRLERIEPALLDELEEHLYGDGVTAVEWPERLPEQIREGSTNATTATTATTIRFRVNGDARHLEITPANARLRQAAAQP